MKKKSGKKSVQSVLKSFRESGLEVSFKKKGIKNIDSSGLGKVAKGVIFVVGDKDKG